MQEFAAAVRQLGCDLETWPEEQRTRALQMLVHACDIGNPAKSLHSSLLWSERILAENFAQAGPIRPRSPVAHFVHMQFDACIGCQRDRVTWCSLPRTRSVQILCICESRSFRVPVIQSSCAAA